MGTLLAMGPDQGRAHRGAECCLLITAEAMITELPKKPAAGPAMPRGGGIGGMDF